MRCVLSGDYVRRSGSDSTATGRGPCGRNARIGRRGLPRGGRGFAASCAPMVDEAGEVPDQAVDLLTGDRLAHGCGHRAATEWADQPRDRAVPTTAHRRAGCTRWSSTHEWLTDSLPRVLACSRQIRPRTSKWSPAWSIAAALAVNLPGGRYHSRGRRSPRWWRPQRRTYRLSVHCTAVVPRLLAGSRSQSPQPTGGHESLASLGAAGTVAARNVVPVARMGPCQGGVFDL